MTQLENFLGPRFRAALLFIAVVLSSCTSDREAEPSRAPQDNEEVKVDKISIDAKPGDKVDKISIDAKSGDKVDFIRKDEIWVNKNNQVMNADYAQEMISVLNGLTYSTVKASQVSTARRALQDKGLRVVVDWINGKQKTFYLVTAFDPSKTFICFSSDSTMKGELQEAWVEDKKKGVSRDFTSVFDVGALEFGAESMRDRSILSMDNPLEQIESIDVTFYDDHGKPNDKSYGINWKDKTLMLNDQVLPMDTLKTRSYIRDFSSIKVQRYHDAYDAKENIRNNEKQVSLTVNGQNGGRWILHVYNMPCPSSFDCLEGEHLPGQYFGEVVGQPSWFELQDYAFYQPMVKPSAFFLSRDKK